MRIVLDRYQPVADWLPADHLAWFVLDVVDQLDLGSFLKPIERRCQEDIAFRVLAGSSTPDHVTIARFRVHEQAQVAELLAQAAAIDQSEDRQHGTARGDELPRALAGRSERLDRVRLVFAEHSQ
jgi:hypothetical protein